MPSTSKAQQQLMGMAYALKKGDMDPKDASQEVKDLADSMTLQQLKDFASTEHKGLPDHVKEAEDHEVGMAMSQLNAISKAVGELLQKIGREEKDLPGWLQDHISQSYNYIKQANDGYYEMDEMVSPDSIGGMGATALPSPTTMGSGDIPKGSGDAKEEEEEEKKRRKELLKKFKSFEEFIGEASLQTISGNSGRTITVLDNKKYELTKDVKNAKVGDYSNVILPKGTIITNLPGGIFANHTSLKQQRNFKWDNNFGVRIRQMPETIHEIEKNGKVLESLNESVESATKQLAKEEQLDGFNAKVVLGKFDGTSIDAQSTDKTWPEGTPVTKYFSRGGYKKYAIKGEYPVVDSDRGWWYYKVGRNWFAVKKDDYETPPFEY